MGTQRQIDMTFDISYPSDQSKFLQRLGEKNPTDIVVQVFNKGVPYNLSGVTLGFEMRNDKEKILIDKDQSRFTLVVPLEGVFSYRPPLQVQSFYGNSYLAYFTFESGANRVTTERFRFYNDEDVQLAVAPELQNHYVSVIDDLVASNKTAMDEAKAIRDLINANGVVKKVGDTMTGDLQIERGAGEKAYSFTKSGTVSTKLLDNDTRTALYSQTNGETVWRYEKGSKTFEIVGATNVVKKAGDTMTGDLNFINGKGISFQPNTGGNPFVISTDSSNRMFMFDGINGKRIFLYDPTTQMFDIQSQNTTLVKKTGDTMTGNLNFASASQIQNLASTGQLVFGNSGIWINDTNGNSVPWQYRYSDKQFIVNAETNLMKKTDYSGKDGRANLTVTSDATIIDSGFGPIADRRGNTVTVRLAIMRNAGATGEIVTNLPANMRPTLTLVKWGIAEDGSPLKYQIHTDGTVRFYTTGKGLRIVETFVTD